MAQSLAKIYIHLIFSTKNREPFFATTFGRNCTRIVGGILRDLEFTSNRNQQRIRPFACPVCHVADNVAKSNGARD